MPRDGVVVFEGSARSGAEVGVTVVWKDLAGKTPNDDYVDVVDTRVSVFA